VRNGGRVDASGTLFGNAGSVTVNAADFVEVNGTVPRSINPSLIISSANVVDESLRVFLGVPALPPSGNAGNVTINTPELRVLNGGEVTVRNDGSGNAGTLTVNADIVRLSDQGSLTASTQSGTGGDITLNLQDALLVNGGLISAEARGLGDGGNLNLTTPFVVARNNSDIIANAFGGRGGNITISTQGLLGTAFRDQLTPESDITASSALGVSGIVDITTLELDPSAGIVALPETPIDPSQQVATGCADTQGSQFIATGRGGVPANPAAEVGRDRTWQDMRDLSAFQQQPVERSHLPTVTDESSILEATTLTIDDQGQINLVAASMEEGRVADHPATCAGHF
ncbi:MAG: S-layer family protein, partial [Cyanobacteria bacterium P01_F01_bin.4]